MLNHINKAYLVRNSNNKLAQEVLNKSFHTLLGTLLKHPGPYEIPIEQLKNYMSEKEVDQIISLVQQSPILNIPYQKQKLFIGNSGYEDFYQVLPQNSSYKIIREFEEKIGFNASFGMTVLEILNNIASDYKDNYANNFRNDLCKAWVTSITSHENFSGIVFNTVPVLSCINNRYYRNDSFDSWSKKMTFCPRSFEVDHLIKFPKLSNFKAMSPILSNLVHESAHAYDYLHYNYKSGRFIEDVLEIISTNHDKQQQYKCLASFFDPILLKTYSAFNEATATPQASTMNEPIAFYMEQLFTINNEGDNYKDFQKNFSDYLNAKVNYLKHKGFNHEQILISIMLMKKFTMMCKPVSNNLSDQNKDAFLYVSQALHQEIKTLSSKTMETRGWAEEVEKILFNNEELDLADIPLIEEYSKFTNTNEYTKD